MTDTPQNVLTPPDNCSICSNDYDSDRGGVQGYFGIMPVTFCEWCYSSIMSMAEGENMSKQIELLKKAEDTLSFLVKQEWFDPEKSSAPELIAEIAEHLKEEGE